MHLNVNLDLSNLNIFFCWPRVKNRAHLFTHAQQAVWFIVSNIYLSPQPCYMISMIKQEIEPVKQESRNEAWKGLFSTARTGEMRCWSVSNGIMNEM